MKALATAVVLIALFCFAYVLAPTTGLSNLEDRILELEAEIEMLKANAYYNLVWDCNNEGVIRGFFGFPLYHTVDECLEERERKTNAAKKPITR